MLSSLDVLGATLQLLSGLTVLEEIYILLSELAVLVHKLLSGLAILGTFINSCEILLCGSHA